MRGIDCDGYWTLHIGPLLTNSLWFLFLFLGLIAACARAGILMVICSIGMVAIAIGKVVCFILALLWDENKFGSCYIVTDQLYANSLVCVVEALYLLWLFERMKDLGNYLNGPIEEENEVETDSTKE